MKVKRRNLVLTAMLSALITASLFIQVDRLSALAEDGHSRLWKGEIKVLNSEPNFGWWLKGYESDIWSHRWRPVADALTSAVRKQGRFREIFCNIFMNSFNDTIFVVLIDLNESIVNEVLDAMKPPPGITVKFLKGDAPLYQLEEWLSLINPEELDRMGIQWSGICITENATILITLEIVTPVYVETITQLIKDKIPPGIITIAKMERPKLCSQPDRIRPLEAGIQVQSFFQGQGTTSTLNFLGIARNTNTEGAIVVGHGSSVGANVYQPTVNPNNLIGQTNINPIRQRFSDAAWVPLNPGVDGENLIYDPNINIWVIGQVDYAQQYVGEMVEALGISSGYRYGYIQAKWGSVSHQIYGTLFNQIQANFTSIPGDSGSPIYQHYYEGGIHTALAFGIQWGASGNTSFYSPPDGIERDSGFDLDFSGP